MRGLQGLRTLVTGGARGIGRAAAERLVADGALVAVVDLVEDEPIDGVVCTLTGDVTSEDDVERFVAAATRELGGLDALVLSAGIHYSGPTHEMSAEMFDKVMAVSLRGTFLACKAALPGMLAQGAGRIVTFGSTAALVGAPGLSAYAAAKGAVLQFTRSIGTEYAARGIRANCLCPGPTNTPLMARLMAERSDPEAFMAKVPLGRFAEPAEIAAAVAFLLSDESSFMIGAPLIQDGGYTAL